MKSRLARIVLPAVLAASIPAAAVFAQSQGQGQQQPPQAQAPARIGPSQEVQTRLHDGRMAMIKEALKLTPEQQNLWAPVEQQLQASFEARQKARAERRDRRQARSQARGQDRAERASLPDRLERRSQRLTERAERAKAFADALKPLYATLSDDQKAVASVVLGREAGMGRRGGHRWAMHRHHRDQR